MTKPSGSPAQASVDTSLIRDRFNFDWATSDPIEDLDTYWWWARSIRVDPNEVIADDDAGNLWSIPFTTDGADEVTFGEPVRVRETFVPVAAGDGAAATALVSRRRQRVAAAALDRPQKQNRPSSASAGTQSEEDDMTDQELRALLGLPEDATQEQVDERVAQLPPVETGDPPAPTGDTETEEQTEPVAASLTPATVAELRAAGLAVVDEGTLTELSAGAEAGRTANGELARQRVTSTLEAAAADGRIRGRGTADWQRWEERLTNNFDAMAPILAEQPAVVPVGERGHGAGTETSADSDAFAARRARINPGGPTARALAKEA